MSIVNGTRKEGRGGGRGGERRGEREEDGGGDHAGGGGRIISGTIVNLEPFTRYAVFVKTVSLDSSARGAQSEVIYATTSPYNSTYTVYAFIRVYIEALVSMHSNRPSLYNTGQHAYVCYNKNIAITPLMALAAWMRRE
ncbi:hypothetical protein GWK47_014819 [Chionoecetes opilio]|uniref:Uncharacterized protein n=1 Tax=Chionoecetes opilio TaxID=41210 RepID=A0A8J4XSY1_CHIOP|nr:hypothetical protein GWK47_014819 [Chionoecetes opilio]